MAFEAECGETDQVRASYKIPLAVKELKLARLSFTSELGALYDVRIALDKLHQPQARLWDVIPILYDRSDPKIVRPVPALSTYLKSARILLGGLLALAIVAAMRWAAAWRGDVEAEVAELRQSAAARAKHEGLYPIS